MHGGLDLVHFSTFKNWVVATVLETSLVIINGIDISVNTFYLVTTTCFYGLVMYQRLLMPNIQDPSFPSTQLDFIFQPPFF